MFYFTTFILALVTWTQQQNGSFSLSPYTTYTPPSQHHIPKEKVTHGVNIYLCEQFQDPITPSINIYYWLRNNLNTCKNNKGNNKITELRTILQRESQNS